MLLTALPGSGDNQGEIKEDDMEEKLKMNAHEKETAKLKGKDLKQLPCKHQARTRIGPGHDLYLDNKKNVKNRVAEATAVRECQKLLKCKKDYPSGWAGGFPCCTNSILC